MQGQKIGIAKRNGEDVAPIMARMQEVNERLETVKVELDKLQNDINAFSMAIPNLPHESVPQGKGEEDNVEVRRWGIFLNLILSQRPCRFGRSLRFN